jgi:hypothetical protein
LFHFPCALTQGFGSLGGSLGGGLAAGGALVSFLAFRRLVQAFGGRVEIFLGTLARFARGLAQLLSGPRQPLGPSFRIARLRQGLA